VSAGVNFTPWLTAKVNEVVEPLGIQRPAIIIPGILGSAQKNGEWVMDPILHIYTDLSNTLLANGYVAGQTLFGFPYDWRQSNEISAIQLRDKINYVKGICNCNKVDLIGHSMGGLIARQYIESNLYQNDIHQIIFLGTPHEGAPQDYLTWEAGLVNSDSDNVSRLYNFILTTEAKEKGFDNVFDYVRNFPVRSVNELLPIYSYLKDKQLGIRTYPINYPINIFLTNLKNKIAQLYNSGIVITNIMGNTGNQNTINTIRVINSPVPGLWENGYPDGLYENIGDQGLERGPGDNTVPAVSSSSILGDSISLNASHNQLPVKAEGLIFKKLTGLNAVNLIDNSYVTNPILVFKLLSPVDMQIVAPDGKKIGKNFATAGEFNEIPDAFYSGFNTDDEYITIPNPLDGGYKVITQGTDNGGEYTVATALFSDNLDLEQDFQGQTTVGQIENINVNLSSTDNTLTIAPEDQIPPTITVQSPQSHDYLRSETFNVGVDVTDSGSGVFSSTLKLDNITVSNNQSIDLFYYSLGNHTLTVDATDYVDNTSHSSLIFRIIATKDSTISDITRCLTLGWINNKTVSDSLIAKLQSSGKDKYKDFLKLLDAQRNKYINEQAYQLLKEDINWLINN
jgi:hypothetical protein